MRAQLPRGCAPAAAFLRKFRSLISCTGCLFSSGRQLLLHHTPRIGFRFVVSRVVKKFRGAHGTYAVGSFEVFGKEAKRFTRLSLREQTCA